MKLSGSTLVVLAALGLVFAGRLGATGPAAAVTALTRPLKTDSVARPKAMNFLTIKKIPAAIGGRRAPVELAETRVKKSVAPPSLRLVGQPLMLSGLNRRRDRFSAVDDLRRPALVGKFQGQPASARIIFIGRTPANDHGGAERLNRFVLRGNQPAPLPGSAAAGLAGAAAPDQR